MQVDPKQYNNFVKNWGLGTRNALERRIVSLSIKDTGLLQNSLRVRFKARRGKLINKVSFDFDVRGFYTAKGVGKGVKIADVAQSSRKPRNWYRQVINKRMEILADQITELYGDAYLANVKIK